MLFMKEQTTGPVHVLLGTPEIIDGNYDPGHQRLQLPSTPVIAKTANGPQKQRRRDYVKQTEQANDKRQVRIEHVFRAPDQVASGQKGSGKVHSVDRLEQKQSGRDPRENQRTFEPQGKADQHISKIAEEEKILQSELPPVERRPNQQPDGPANLEPQRQP